MFYYRELTDLIGSKHNIEPLITSGNKGTILKTDKTTASRQVLLNCFNNLCIISYIR